MAKNEGRWRCLKKGCNPVLNKATAEQHAKETKEIEGVPHSVAKWPVRSESGKKKARARNKSGYYDKYNVGAKSYASRVAGGHLPDRRDSVFSDFGLYDDDRSFLRDPEADSEYDDGRD